MQAHQQAVMCRSSHCLTLLTVLLVYFIASLKGSLLDTRIPPSITKNPVRQLYFKIGGAVMLDCGYTGLPTPSFEWFKNGASVDLNALRATVSKQPGNCSVQFDEAFSEHDGFYQCVVSSQHGKATTSVAYLAKAVTTSRSPNVKELSVTEGSPARIDMTSGKWVPTPTYTWALAYEVDEAGGTDVQLSRRVQIDEAGNLYFAHTVFADSATEQGKLYKLNLYNKIFGVKSGSSYTRFTVTRVPGGPTQASPTSAFSSTSTVVAVEARNVSLRCFFNGNPDPEISWSKNGGSLPMGRSEQLRFNSELLIHDVRQEDEGEYICTGQNTMGVSSVRIRLVVQAAPVFQSQDINDRPHDKNVTEGDTVSMNCNAKAEPDAQITWFWNGNKLDPSKPNTLPRKMYFSNNQRTLSVNSVCKNCVEATEGRPTDLMVIQCNASNQHGYVFANGYINVLNKTTIVTRPTDATVTTATFAGNVSIPCRATSDPLTPLIVNWYRVMENHDLLFVYNITGRVLIDADKTLNITIRANDTQNWSDFKGTYKCHATVDGDRSQDEAFIRLSILDEPETGVISDYTETNVIAVASRDCTEVNLNACVGTVGYRTNYTSVTNTQLNAYCSAVPACLKELDCLDGNRLLIAAKDFSDYICGEGRQVLIRNQACFSSATYRALDQACVDSFNAQNPAKIINSAMCTAFQNFLSCEKEAAKKACNDESGKFVATATKKFFQPINPDCKLGSCSLKASLTVLAVALVYAAMF